MRGDEKKPLFPGCLPAVFGVDQLRRCGARRLSGPDYLQEFRHTADLLELLSGWSLLWFWGNGRLGRRRVDSGKRTCPLFLPCLPRRCRSDWLLHRFFPLCGGQDHPLRHYGPGIYPRPVWSVLHCDTLRGRGNRLSGRTTVNIYRPDPAASRRERRNRFAQPRLSGFPSHL